MPGTNALPFLTTRHIEALAATWGDGGLWDDVLWLADRFTIATTGEDRVVAWHHLVLAVGNFKRQPGRRLRPAPLTGGPPPPRSAAPFTLPADPGDLFEVVVDPESPKSWSELEIALPGAGVPTASTLLAALFPDRHFVFDWRVHAAAIGLCCAAGLPAPVDVSASKMPGRTWDAYGEVRARLLDTAAASGQPLVAVERALYRLSQKAGSETGRTWGAYGQVIVGELHKVAAP